MKKMGKATTEWADRIWNPITGCTQISEGCANCYAKITANKLQGLHGYPADEPFRVTLHQDKFVQPLCLKKSKKAHRIQVCTMGDLFHEDVSFNVIATVFGVMAACPQHTFILMTKRPANMLKFFDELTKRAESKLITEVFTHDDLNWRRRYTLGVAAKKATGDGNVVTQDLKEWPIPNVWLGVSVENQTSADERIPILLQTPAAVKFVNVEPMLGSVNILRSCDVVLGDDRSIPAVEGINRWLHWVICGGETGPSSRPMHPEWVRNLRDQCITSKIPFFFNSWGAWLPSSQASEEQMQILDLLQKKHINYRDDAFDGKGFWGKAGKVVAGRILDGEEWSEMPGFV